MPKVHAINCLTNPQKRFIISPPNIPPSSAPIQVTAAQTVSSGAALHHVIPSTCISSTSTSSAVVTETWTYRPGNPIPRQHDPPLSETIRQEVLAVVTGLFAQQQQKGATPFLSSSLDSMFSSIIPPMLSTQPRNKPDQHLPAIPSAVLEKIRNKRSSFFIHIWLANWLSIKFILLKQ